MVEEMTAKRLSVVPMTDEELLEMINNAAASELAAAYQEMLDGCTKDPENRLWYTAWKIVLKENQKQIGSLGFKGPVSNYSVEIGYGIDNGYQNKGYATEACRAAVEWAFKQENIYFIEAETEADNEASKKVLMNLDFQPDGEGEEGPRFIKEKAVTLWMPIYMMFGLSIGLAIGSNRGNESMGLSLGICLGLAVGALLDMNERRKRNIIKEARKEAK